MTGSFAVLDYPAWHSLRGPHRRFAVPGQPDGSRAFRYRPDIAPFAAVEDPDDPQSWNALAALTGPGDSMAVQLSPSSAHGVRRATAPTGWTVVTELLLTQMISTIEETPGVGDPVVELTSADVDEMLALAKLTKPGPFARATVDLGGYLGIRRGGRLVAMAGRRFGPPGWGEVSAVCTHPGHRGQGLSRRLVSAVTAGIRRDGNRPFLHVMHENKVAARIYESMGFVRRADLLLTVVRPPES
ncbi:GNAT family N-acetyltransferase [Amycolatopsis sp. NPDC049253]|uniref:GNAT family N-acetyltransferase n=1 Tax=Amycolatopsis sp. NPDC049253 TaxID=3155274 RepID=UPI003432604A